MTAPDRGDPLVYSTEPSLRRECPRCKAPVASCRCPVNAVGRGPVCAVLRMEKAHRGGKVVTVIDRLPRSEDYLRNLATDLKKKLGCGGTYDMTGDRGVITLQGDKRDALRVELTRRGIRCKG